VDFLLALIDRWKCLIRFKSFIHGIQIGEQRCLMAAKVYPTNHQLGAVLEHKGCVSDIEEAEKKDEAPVRRIPDWRAHSLTTTLHHFDTMVMAQAVHHKTKSINSQVYGRLATKFRHTKGLNKVPRNLPLDCYAKVWWDGLSKFEQDTVSKVPAFGLEELAKAVDNLMSKTSKKTAPTAGPSNTLAAATKRVRSPKKTGAPGVSGEGSMNVD